eukprot:752631-Hanusia_phi.AAC.1
MFDLTPISSRSRSMRRRCIEPKPTRKFRRHSKQGHKYEALSSSSSSSSSSFALLCSCLSCSVQVIMKALEVEQQVLQEAKSAKEQAELSKEIQEDSDSRAKE